MKDLFKFNRICWVLLISILSTSPTSAMESQEGGVNNNVNYFEGIDTWVPPNSLAEIALAILLYVASSHDYYVKLDEKLSESSKNSKLTMHKIKIATKETILGRFYFMLQGGTILCFIMGFFGKHSMLSYFYNQWLVFMITYGVMSFLAYHYYLSELVYKYNVKSAGASSFGFSF